MTRTVADAALMMCELSKPDERDPMSLPPQEIAWLDLEREPRGLRIGLQLEAGIGLPVELEVRAAIVRAAEAFRQAGVIVETMPPFLTQDMLDGLDDFWRQRAWAEIGALPRERQDKVLPYIYAWAERGRSLSGAQVHRGMSQMLAIRHAALKAAQPFDYVLSPVSPVPSFAAELASPLHDPERPFEHIVFTVAANMSDQPFGLGPCRHDGIGPADRPADHRETLRRSRRAAAGADLGAAARAGAGMAARAIPLRSRAPSPHPEEQPKAAARRMLQEVPARAGSSFETPLRGSSG